MRWFNMVFEKEKTREERYEEIQKAWENATFADDFIFCEVMEDRELCKELLENLLHIKIAKLEPVIIQKSIRSLYESKSVRLDVYIQDSNRKFDIEIQTKNFQNLAMRSRYYQGVLDVNSLLKGDEYYELNETFVIFICTKDPFGKGLAEYKFKNYCLTVDNGEEPIELGDKSVKLFYNASDFIKSSSKFVEEFLKFINTNQANTDFTKRLSKKVKEVKYSKIAREEYMSFLLDMQDEHRAGKLEGITIGVQKGMQQGAHEKTIEMAKAMLQYGISQDKVVLITGLPLEQVTSLL